MTERSSTTQHPDGSVRGFVDEFGRPFVIQDCVPLSEPWIAVEDRLVWRYEPADPPATAPRSRHGVLDLSTAGDLRRRGLVLTFVGLEMSRGEPGARVYGLQAMGGREELAPRWTPGESSVLPVLLVRGGVANHWFSEGGPAPIGVLAPHRRFSTDPDNAVLSPARVRAAVGTGFSKIAAADIDNAALLDVEVVSAGDHFELRAMLLGTPIAIGAGAPNAEERFKMLRVRWDVGDGDPRARLVAAAAEIRLADGEDYSC